MASIVSVTPAAINGGINCCKVSIQKLESAARQLQQNYQRAGAGGWSDSKYRDLGSIVSECNDALTKPVTQLTECIGKLQRLLEAVNEYESSGLR